MPRKATRRLGRIFPFMFEVVVEKRGRSRWEWRVCNSAGKIMMSGWEDSRNGAKYRGDRALFHLLLASPGPDEPPFPD
ncbi:hypothetical protein [Bradyrhizobium sp. STM 3562]|uniref:hypothetical protein n=1 Tax=Bradyrhizobium sp. STM 3562 TaxID=578924 RepID=UPI00389050B7